MKIFLRIKVRAYTCGRVHTLYGGGGLVAKLCPTLVTPWTVAHQALLSMGFFQARILEWIAISSSNGNSQPRDRTCVSCTGMCVLYH